MSPRALQRVHAGALAAGGTTFACAMLALFGLVGCAPIEKREHQEHSAAAYNVQLGMAYMNQGDLVLAKEKLDKAMSEDASSSDVHSAMAMLEDRLNHPDKADKEFREALRLGPRSPELLNNYAVYLCRTGRTDDGVKIFEEVAHNALYRTPEAAYTNAGVCLRAAKRDTEAAMSFQRALEIKPNFSEAAFQLVDLDYSRGELTDARAELDRFLGAFEATPDLLLAGVRVAHRQRDRLAQEHFTRKLQLDFPNSAQARAVADSSHDPG